MEAQLRGGAHVHKQGGGGGGGGGAIRGGGRHSVPKGGGGGGGMAPPPPPPPPGDTHADPWISRFTDDITRYVLGGGGGGGGGVWQRYVVFTVISVIWV